MTRVILGQLCFLVTFACLAVGEDVVEDVLESPLGKLKGATLETRLGKKIFAFRGVRYAEPPVGQQRFQVKYFRFFDNIKLSQKLGLWR